MASAPPGMPNHGVALLLLDVVRKKQKSAEEQKPPRKIHQRTIQGPLPIDGHETGGLNLEFRRVVRRFCEQFCQGRGLFCQLTGRAIMYSFVFTPGDGSRKLKKDLRTPLSDRRRPMAGFTMRLEHRERRQLNDLCN